MTNYFRKGALIVGLVTLAATSFSQQLDPVRVSDLAHAIAKAEGFGVKGTLPTRNHNPGDIKRNGSYIHFKNDAAGWVALKQQVAQLASGKSKHYRLTMTINEVSKTYAGDYRWGRIVAKTLNVAPTTTLRAYFNAPDVAPVISATINDQVLRSILEITPSLPNLHFDVDQFAVTDEVDVPPSKDEDEEILVGRALLRYTNFI